MNSIIITAFIVIIATVILISILFAIFYPVKEKNIQLKISIPYNSDCSIDKIVLDFDSINMEEEVRNNVRLSKLQ